MLFKGPFMMEKITTYYQKLDFLFLNFGFRLLQYARYSEKKDIVFQILIFIEKFKLEI